MPVIEAPIAGVIGPDTEDNLQRLFLENNWTDKLPIVLPTRERVDAMLAGTSHPPDEINVVVVGGEANGYWRIMAAKYRKTVSIDAWR